MKPDKIESEEADIMLSDSSYEYQEPKKKPKKLRSNRLMRFPSLRSSSSTRRVKSEDVSCPNNGLAGYAASSEQSTPLDMSDSSSQKSARMFIRRSSFRPASVKKSILIKPAQSQNSRLSSREADNHYEQHSVSNKQNLNSHPISESSSGSSNQSGYPSLPILKKSLVRTSSLKKPVRIMTKKASTKSKISRFQSQGVEKATCSSSLKVSNKPGESETSLTMHVCTYTYCSFHGHRHDDVPPLKRFVSIRRRALKSQKRNKPEKIHDSSKEGNKGGFVKVYATPKKSRGKIQSSEDQHQTIDFPMEDHRHNLTKGSDNFSLEHDDNISTGHSEIQMNREKSKGDNISGLNLKRPKNLRLWHLIYQNMVTGLETEPETQSSSSGSNSEQLLGVNGSKSSLDRPREIPSMNMNDHDDEFQKNELYKNDAIKLVREAFDRILSEIPDQASDNQSVTSETTSYQEIFEEKDSGDEQPSISNSDSVINDALQTPKVKVESMDVNKSKHQALKNWNSLKKIIVLKRFVKTLEKVKNINFREPRYLDKENEPETEKVHLKNQSTKDGKKNSEEWMLDFALQQVISSLAPAQKRKVSLLVQAFETIIPFPGPGTHQKAPSQVHMESSDQNAAATHKENSFGVMLSKRLISRNENQDQVSEINRVKLKAAPHGQLEAPSAGTGWTKFALGMLINKSRTDNDFAPEQDQCDVRLSALSSNLGRSVTDSNEKDRLNGNIFEEVPSQENCDGFPHLNNVESDISNVSMSNKESSIKGQNHLRSIEHTVSSSNLETQKSFTMWHLIHKQMKSGLVDEAPNQPCFEEVENAPSLVKTNAIKLVQEAFDKILSEIPDNSSDNQSVISETTSYQEELIEEHRGDGDEQETIKSDSYSDTKEKDPEGSRPFKEEKAESNKKSLKNWSRLKKLIVFQRFVKALEKVKNPDREEEKVSLKHRITAERKYEERETEKVSLRHLTDAEKNYGEKWMLDYALRNVISNLAPAQKRKVALLVQAFETVIPPEANVESSPHNSGRTPKENSFKVSLHESAKPDIGSIQISDQVHEQKNPENFVKDKEKDEEHVPSPKPDGGLTNTTEQFLVPERILLETLVPDAEVQDEEKMGPTDSEQHDTQLEKQSYKKLWYFVYQHMASSNEAKEGNQPGDQETDENINDQNAGDVKLRQIEALRLVEQAIDEIPEIQDDSSDVQSVTSEQSPDDSFEKTSGTKVEQSIPQEGEKPRPAEKKGWSNLKKMILLKRFLKALEKVKEPNYVKPNKPDDPEAEKVNLKRRDALGRRNSEEWMLDHAMQQVVATLTPARKRKVALLVEAFESVAH
ncbi:hypothetical protein ACFE04_029712 [Oxalis oulophora]